MQRVDAALPCMNVCFINKFKGGQKMSPEHHQDCTLLKYCLKSWALLCEPSFQPVCRLYNTLLSSPSICLSHSFPPCPVSPSFLFSFARLVMEDKNALAQFSKWMVHLRSGSWEVLWIGFPNSASDLGFLVFILEFIKRECIIKFPVSVIVLFPHRDTSSFLVPGSHIHVSAAVVNSSLLFLNICLV